MRDSVRRHGGRAVVAAAGIAAALALAVAPANAAVGDPFVDSCLNAGTAQAPCSSAPGQTGAYREALSPDGKQLYLLATGGGSDEPAIIVYDRNTKTGKLTRRDGAGGCVTQSGSSGGCGQAAQLDNPQDIVVSPDGTSVYVSNAGTNTIVQLQRAADGTLTAGARCLGNGTGCTAVTGMGVAHALAITPDGKSVYLRTDGGEGSGTLLAFDRAPDGALTQRGANNGCWSEVAQAGCTTAAGLSHQGWQLAATNSNVYATGWNESYTYYTYGCFAPPYDYICGYYFSHTSPPTGSVAIFHRASDGTLSQAAAPNGCISNNAMTGGTGSAFGTASNPPPVRCIDGSDALDQARGVTISQDGDSVYVGTQYGVIAYSRSGDTLTQTSCLETPGAGKAGCTDAPGVGDVYRMAVTPNGDGLVTASNGVGGFAFLDRNASTGALSARAGGEKQCLTNDGTGGACDTLAPLGGLGDVAVSGDSLFVYLVNQTNGVLATLHRDVAPVCDAKTISVPYQQSVAVPLTCTDANGDALTLAITRQPTNGTLAGAIDTTAGTIRYSPALGYTGMDSFEYAAAGHGVPSAPARVTLNVQAPPPPPTGGDDGGGTPTGGGGTPTGGGGTTPTGGGGSTPTGGGGGNGGVSQVTVPGMVPAKVGAKWKVRGKQLTLTQLNIKKLPRHWSAKAVCKGRKCPFKTRKLKNRKVKKGTLNALRALGKKHTFRAGQTLELRISAKGYSTKIVRFKLKKGKKPRAATLCLPPGAKTATKSCG